MNWNIEALVNYFVNDINIRTIYPKNIEMHNALFIYIVMYLETEPARIAELYFKLLEKDKSDMSILTKVNYITDTETAIVVAKIMLSNYYYGRNSIISQCIGLLEKWQNNKFVPYKIFIQLLSANRFRDYFNETAKGEIAIKNASVADIRNSMSRNNIIGKSLTYISIVGTDIILSTNYIGYMYLRFTKLYTSWNSVGEEFIDKIIDIASIGVLELEYERSNEEYSEGIQWSLIAEVISRSSIILINDEKIKDDPIFYISSLSSYLVRIRFLNKQN